MNIKLIAASLTAVCALAACQSNMATPNSNVNYANDTRTGNYQTRPVNMPDEFYECKKGMGVKVKYLGNSRIAIAMNTDSNAVAELSQARAASGEMYATNQGFYGKYTEWHQKNGQASLVFDDPYGNRTETECVKK